MASTFEFCKKRIAEIIAVGLFAVGVLCLVALLSFDPADPSFNNETDTAPANWGGGAGAFIAGPLLSAFGLASAVFIILPLTWGFLLAKEKSLPRWWSRITFTIICLPLAAGAFAMLDPWVDMSETWPSDSFGGVIGDFMRDDLSALMGSTAFLAFASIGALLAFYMAAGITPAQWANVFAFFYALCALAWRSIASLFSGLASIKKLGVQQAYQEQVRKNKAAPIPKPRKVGLIEKKENAPRAGRKSMQTSLDLRVPNSYELPPVTLLKSPAKNKKQTISESSLEHNATLLEKVLEDFGIQGNIVKVRPGPVVTLYELEPSPGTKSSRVVGLSDDIARSMSAVSARIAVIPGRNAIGIELPNEERETVYFRSLLEADEFAQSQHRALALVLGKTLEGDPFIMDLAKMPHLLIAGTTGSGKSVGINAMILSLLYQYTPDECKFIMIDPKMLELSVYDGIPHLLAPVVTEPGKAIVALKWTVKEMENRYRLMSNLGVRNIDGYNQRIQEARANAETLTRTVQTGFDPESGKPTYEKVDIEMVPLPYIVVVVDEMADLMIVSGKDIESSIQRLAQMARAAGIHIIMATQRPSVDVITGVIKANFPTRISFQVTSRIDSRTILGEQGAEQLLGMGDMLYMAGGSRITRVHGPFVDDKEVEKVVDFWKRQGTPKYIEDVTTSAEEDEFGMENGEGSGDELYDQAVAIVYRDRRVSTSYIQRCLKIGYNRAANIIEKMEREGVVSPPSHTGKREVIGG